MTVNKSDHDSQQQQNNQPMKSDKSFIMISNSTKNKTENGLTNQYLASIVANLASFSYGIGLGWSSPNLPLLLSDESPLTTGSVTIDESSWISSVFCIGGACGSILFSYLLDLIGRKWCIILIGLPQCISWLLIAFIFNLNALFLARFLIGLSGGAILVTIPLFTTEIADNRIRGVLGSMFGVCACLGTLLAFIIAHYFEYVILPLVALIPTIIFPFVFYLYFPDTPQYLSKHLSSQIIIDNNKTNEIINSIKFYKQISNSNINDDDLRIFQELKKLNEENSNNSQQQNRITFSELLIPTTRKAMLLGALAIATSQFCGTFAIINYTASIFHDSGSTLHPNVCAMIIAAIQVLSTFVSISLVDRLGRRILIIISASGTGLSLVSLGLYFYLNSIQSDIINYISWLPIVSLSGAMFIVAIAVSSLPFVISVELLPPRLRSTIPSYFIVMLWILAFLFVKYFNTMVSIMTMYGCMWFFASCCFFEVIIMSIFLPETKGKSYEEIRLALMAK